eukprot:GHVR01086492.1.p1 GENE.GHVR01086492.1~~GHVR01086492.1.p1  ORF type:complete len:286 (+),score=55.66 GHVR01086492.1:324-1181(+)
MRGIVCGICSEENEDFIRGCDDSKFVVLMDPLDGSSNIEVNVSVGTIFAILERVTPIGSEVTLDDFLQPGKNIVCAGYVLYGSCTQLVCTTGNGVQGFTLDRSLGTFYLSHPELKFPNTAHVYSVNEGNMLSFSPGVCDFIDWCQSPVENEHDRGCSLRYIGSFVSDFHRNLIHGGIYMYPPTKKDLNGKLRMLYECNPMAMIAEQAGGMASNGHVRILDIIPTSLHQRSPIFTGTNSLVIKCLDFISNETNDTQDSKTDNTVKRAADAEVTTTAETTAEQQRGG